MGVFILKKADRNSEDLRFAPYSVYNEESADRLAEKIGEGAWRPLGKSNNHHFYTDRYKGISAHTSIEEVTEDLECYEMLFNNKGNRIYWFAEEISTEYLCKYFANIWSGEWKFLPTVNKNEYLFWQPEQGNYLLLVKKTIPKDTVVPLSVYKS